AVGLSRQLYGRTIATERADHRMMESWHPLGVCGVISAFNFPVAVWSWNAALALVCGDPVVWKPSDKTPLTALAVQAVVERALRRFGDAPDGLSSVLIGGAEIGEALVDDPRVAVVSATGSTAMGRAVGPRLAARFARAPLGRGAGGRGRGPRGRRPVRLPPPRGGGGGGGGGGRGGGRGRRGGAAPAPGAGAGRAPPPPPPRCPSRPRRWGKREPPLGR